MKSFEINDFRPLTLDCFAFAFACALISSLAYYLIGTFSLSLLLCLSLDCRPGTGDCRLIIILAYCLLKVKRP